MDANKRFIEIGTTNFPWKAHKNESTSVTDRHKTNINGDETCIQQKKKPCLIANTGLACGLDPSALSLFRKPSPSG